MSVTPIIDMSASQRTRQKKKQRIFLAGQRSHDKSLTTMFDELTRKYEDMQTDMKAHHDEHTRQVQHMIDQMLDFTVRLGVPSGVDAASVSMHLPVHCYSKKNLTVC